MEPASIFASVKFAYDIAKGLNSLNTIKERNEAVSKVLEVLLSVQNDALTMQKEHSLLLTEKDNLIKKISEFEKWYETESKYQLQELAPGVTVYAYKVTNESTEPMHLLCANCFSKKQKGFYVRSEIMLDGIHYKCLNCDKEIIDYTHKDKRQPKRASSVDPLQYRRT